MNESKARVWKKIVVFYTLTLLFSGVFDAFVLHAGKMDAGNFLYVTGAMWSPALAAFATKALFRESIRDLRWGLGRAKYAWLGYSFRSPTRCRFISSFGYWSRRLCRH